jgi:2-polyprenyl-3-methyl-5-hydroxy-6-metoxy-1,4-benzoquinol methylase
MPCEVGCGGGFLCEKSAKMCSNKRVFLVDPTKQTRVFGRPHFLLYYLYILNAKSGVGCGGGFLCEKSAKIGGEFLSKTV